MSDIKCYVCNVRKYFLDTKVAIKVSKIWGSDCSEKYQPNGQGKPSDLRDAGKGSDHDEISLQVLIYFQG